MIHLEGARLAVSGPLTIATVATLEGEGAAHTGAACVDWCGHQLHDGFSVAGNMLAGHLACACMRMEAWLFLMSSLHGTQQAPCCSARHAAVLPACVHAASLALQHASLCACASAPGC